MRNLTTYMRNLTFANLIDERNRISEVPRPLQRVPSFSQIDRHTLRGARRSKSSGNLFDHLEERQFRRGDTGLAAALYALRPLHRHVTQPFSFGFAATTLFRDTSVLAKPTTS